MYELKYYVENMKLSKDEKKDYRKGDDFFISAISTLAAAILMENENIRKRYAGINKSDPRWDEYLQVQKIHGSMYGCIRDCFAGIGLDEHFYPMIVPILEKNGCKEFSWYCEGGMQKWLDSLVFRKKTKN